MCQREGEGVFLLVCAAGVARCEGFAVTSRALEEERIESPGPL